MALSSTLGFGVTAATDLQASLGGPISSLSDLAIDISRPEGRLFQGASLSIFLLLPTAAQIHFILKFFAGTAYRGDVKLWSGFGHLSHYVPLRDALMGRFTYDRVGELAPTFAPFWQPWLFVFR
jgi:hypothetical protein